MSLVSGALQLGKSALLSYQSALQVVGNNIANAGVDGYTRLSPRLTSLAGVPLPEQLMPGGGVALTDLQRRLNEALEARLRAAVGDEQRILMEQQALARIESLYNELSDTDLSSLLNAFFNAFEEVQNDPTDLPARDVVLSTGRALAEQMQRMRADLLRLHDQLNEQVVESTRQANDLATQLAGLNLQIVASEAGSKGAAASLRDQRDRVLKDLAALMDIRTLETPEGAVSVFVGNEPLVEYGTSRGLRAVEEMSGDRALVTVRFADNNGQVQIANGELAGLAIARDTHVYGQIQALDGLAAVLIREVNRVHSQGQGLVGFSSLTGAYHVLDAGVPLNSAAAGLAFAPVNGTFKITVRDDATGQSIESVIEVDLDGIGADTSLADLAAQINAKVANVTASVTGDNRLTIQAVGSYTFTFSQDTSGVLAALGMNVLFTGSDAATIAVEPALAADSRFLAAATSGTPGDGANAGSLSRLADSALASLGGVSLSQRWRQIVAQLAVTSASAKNLGEAAHGVAQSLASQREAISGVNLDEEAVNLMRFQRSFQAAARYVTLVDELINEMLGMIR